MASLGAKTTHAPALSPPGAIDVSRQSWRGGSSSAVLATGHAEPDRAATRRAAKDAPQRSRTPTRSCTAPRRDYTAGRALWRPCCAPAMTLARPPANRCKVAALPQRPTRAGFRGPAPSAIRPMHNTNTDITLEQLRIYDGDELIFDGSDPSTYTCLLYTSPSPRDRTRSRMPSSA